MGTDSPTPTTNLTPTPILNSNIPGQYRLFVYFVLCDCMSLCSNVDCCSCSLFVVGILGGVVAVILLAALLTVTVLIIVACYKRKRKRSAGGIVTGAGTLYG